MPPVAESLVRTGSAAEPGAEDDDLRSRFREAFGGGLDVAPEAAGVSLRAGEFQVPRQQAVPRGGGEAAIAKARKGLAPRGAGRLGPRHGVDGQLHVVGPSTEGRRDINERTAHTELHGYSSGSFHVILSAAKNLKACV
jgi:hypothetical protein